MDRAAADRIGMLATVMNSIAMTDGLTRLGYRVHLMTAVPMPTVGDPIDALKAKRYLKEGCVVVFAGGTAIPFSRPIQRRLFALRRSMPISS